LDSGGLLIGNHDHGHFSPSGESGGIGLAIPVDEINRYVPETLSKGNVDGGPGLACSWQPEIRKRSANVAPNQAVVVRSVFTEARRQAGIRPHGEMSGIHADVIVPPPMRSPFRKPRSLFAWRTYPRRRYGENNDRARRERLRDIEGGHCGLGDLISRRTSTNTLPRKWYRGETLQLSLFREAPDHKLQVHRKTAAYRAANPL